MSREQAIRKRHGRRSGFTLIEVMVSLGIMTIGAMAILALQQHAIRANIHARQLTVATLIAQRWIERLKQDAHRWNEIADTGTVGAALANTRYLRAIVGNPGVYQSFPSDAAALTNERAAGFDFYGFDSDGSQAAADPARAVVFCAAFRPTWVYFGHAMRVDVRVWWPRQGSGADFVNDIGPDCLPNGAGHTQLDPGGDLFDRYHVVYLSTVIRVNEVTR